MVSAYDLGKGTEEEIRYQGRAFGKPNTKPDPIQKKAGKGQKVPPMALCPGIT